jgi:hypothetical protein
MLSVSTLYVFDGVGYPTSVEEDGLKTSVEEENGGANEQTIAIVNTLAGSALNFFGVDVGSRLLSRTRMDESEFIVTSLA